MNVTEKILSTHLVEGTLAAGEEISIRIDQTLTQDATGTMAYLQFEAMGLDRIRNDLAVSYVDHNTIQTGFENADDHRYLQSVASKFGVIFSRPGNGICHQLHMERFGAPGKTLLGSDSHTPTAGAMGMIAIGAGGLDVAVAMAGGAFHVTAPRVIGIRLKGRLHPWVSAKDVVLKVLEIFSTEGNTGCVFEYTGPGLATLDITQRATIANMGAECGVTTSVFPSDESTRAFLRAQGREEAWREILPDPDAAFHQMVEIDLTAIEPLAAAPHSPGNIVTVASIEGIRVDQVLIGSCTNSSLRDMKLVAGLLRGRRVHPSVSLGIACGSRQVLSMLANDRSLSHIISAGARLLENTCGFCIGNSQSPADNAVSLRTSNRNFEGRSGTRTAKVYLVSPEVAVVSAIRGVITDPRGTSFRRPRIPIPARMEIDDSMFISPAMDPAGVEILRGPNIGKVPRNSEMPEDIKGIATIKVGDKITTDHIMPAGARMKYRSNIPVYSRFVFEPVDPDFSARAVKARDKGIHNIVIAGSSYGQGSSREHAAMCPMVLGVKAVVAKSIERIHQTNLINFGIAPFVFTSSDDYGKIAQGDSLRISGARAAVAQGCGVVLVNETSGAEIPLSLAISGRNRDILLAGGVLNLMRLDGVKSQ